MYKVIETNKRHFPAENEARQYNAERPLTNWVVPVPGIHSESCVWLYNLFLVLYAINYSNQLSRHIDQSV
jgi:hypothetical protein